MKRPVIGITANHDGIDDTVRDAYGKQILAAGGVPLIIPSMDDADAVVDMLERVDGIVLTGGGDYNPLWCGEQPSPLLHSINAERDRAELLLTRLASDRQIPMLGICRGMQTLAMALGGHVAQDLSMAQNAAARERSEGVIKHSQDAARCEATHSVSIADGSMLSQVYGADTIYVNSFHHQVVDATGDGFRAVALSPDGMIEAMEAVGARQVMGVQWHPEWLGKDGLPLFQWLVAAAANYRRAVVFHHHHLILDSHCDTPMFFHQGVDFLRRDSRILVDLHKMTEGRQDATTMVCYLPQTDTGNNGAPASHHGKSFSELVHFPIDSPKQYADFIFDEIEKITKAAPEYVALAAKPEDLYANKRMGKKSIVLGIENGLALEGSLDNLRHFAERGICYLTLCHNGDNDVCDSARGNATHGGLSPFGREVVAELNSLGVMVDLSHAAESSFYDAIAVSKTPIVCSHSNCRALCDHPRNLTDDQMRALAQSGGVMQVTLYPGFLVKDGEADINDVVHHLRHAISVMGIDHVGIGTDFDGDGGVLGVADASQLINLTMLLLREGFTENDLAKIWSGNWLRVMRQAKDASSNVF